MVTRFGKLLRRTREAAGVTMGQLARHLKVSTPYLSDVEKGFRHPLDRDKILSAAAFLKIDPEQLLKEAAKTRGRVQLELGSNPRAQAVGAALLRGWPDLTNQQLEEIERVLMKARSNLK